MSRNICLIFVLRELLVLLSKSVVLVVRCWQDCAPERLKAPGCWLKASVTTSQANPCRNYRVLGLSKVKSEIKPWFPTTTLDADNIGTNKWKPKMDRMW